MSEPAALLKLLAVNFPAQAEPPERTAAAELARLAGQVARASARPGRGVNVALARRGWCKLPPAAGRGQPGWIWIRLSEGAGEIGRAHV